MGASLPASFLFSLTFLFHPSRSLTTTTVVNDLAKWKIPTTLHVGDSLVFEHKRLQKLHTFNNRRAFDQCNFSEATILNKGSSSHLTWSPSRPGYYYFSTKDNCDKGEKVLVRAITLDLSPGFPPMSAPPPTSGGDFPSPSSPNHHRGWGWVPGSPSTPSPAPQASPLEPREGIAPSSSTVPPSGAPEAGSGIPFISSNPTVPLPTGETDTATIRPLPTPGDGNQVVGLGVSLRNQRVPSASATMLSLAVVLWM